MNWKKLFGFDDSVSSLQALLDQSFQAFELPLDPAGERLRASGYLLGLRTEQLLDLDERFRSYRSASYRHWPDDALVKITSAAVEPTLRQALLFLAASHTDGRTRQKVVWALPQFPGRLALAAALIRCTDWVPQVEFAAQNAVLKLLELAADEDVLALWPLVIRLQSRTRLARGWFREHVEGWVFNSQKLQCLLELLRNRDARVRSWAFAQCLDNDIPLPINTLDTAIHDPNPAIALHALRHAQGRGDAARVQSLAREGWSSSHPVIRRESLRTLAGSAESLSRELLHQGLRDRSAGVRALAAFLLRERYAEDPRAYWRGTLDDDTDRPTLGALISLADAAEAQDITRFRRWLSDPAGIVRMHCLRGILKINGDISNRELTELLGKGGTRVLNLLAGGVRRGSIPLDLDRAIALIEALRSISAARPNFRQLFAHLGHWERLSIILRIHADGGHEALLLATDLLADWIKVSTRYAPLGRNRRTELLSLLEARRAEIDATSFDTIQQAIIRH